MRLHVCVFFYMFFGFLEHACVVTGARMRAMYFTHTCKKQPHLCTAYMHNYTHACIPVTRMRVILDFRTEKWGTDDESS